MQQLQQHSTNAHYRAMHLAAMRSRVVNGEVALKIAEIIAIKSSKKYTQCTLVYAIQSPLVAVARIVRTRNRAPKIRIQRTSSSTSLDIVVHVIWIQ